MYSTTKLGGDRLELCMYSLNLFIENVRTIFRAF